MMNKKIIQNEISKSYNCSNNCHQNHTMHCNPKTFFECFCNITRTRLKIQCNCRNNWKWNWYWNWNWNYCFFRRKIELNWIELNEKLNYNCYNIYIHFFQLMHPLMTSSQPNIAFDWFTKSLPPLVVLFFLFFLSFPFLCFHFFFFLFFIKSFTTTCLSFLFFSFLFFSFLSHLTINAKNCLWVDAWCLKTPGFKQIAFN